MSIRIVQGDLLKRGVDVIVNPANTFLRHGGGLARLIDRAAQGEHVGITYMLNDPRAQENSYPVVVKWRQDHQNAGLVPTGGALLTSAGLLPQVGVIHAVGPVWGGGRYYESLLLDCVHHSVFQIAKSAGFRSVALPAISCGVFGYPVERAAAVALSVADAWEDAFDLIEFVLFEDDHFKVFQHAADVQ